jgi:hypothetical protein
MTEQTKIPDSLPECQDYIRQLLSLIEEQKERIEYYEPYYNKYVSIKNIVNEKTH